MRHPIIGAAIIIAAGLLAARATGSRYQLAVMPGGILRLDTVTGEVVVCVPDKEAIRAELTNLVDCQPFDLRPKRWRDDGSTP